MNAEDLLEKALSNDPSPVFKRGDSMDTHPSMSSLLFRDEELEMVYRQVKSIMSGNSKNVLLFGMEGCGKSILLETVYSTMKGREEITVSFIKCDPEMKRSEFYGILYREMTGERGKKVIRQMKEAIKRKSSTVPSMLFLDDIHVIEYRTKRDLIDFLDGNSVSLIATSNDGHESSFDWDSKITLRPYSRDQLIDIGAVLLKTSVREDFNVDDFVLKSTASHVERTYGSSASAFLFLLEEGLKKAERECIFERRDARELLMKDIEFACKKYEDRFKKEILSIDCTDDVRMSMVMRALLPDKKYTIKDMTDTVSKRMKRLFPLEKTPSKSSIRNSLVKLKKAGIVESRWVNKGIHGRKMFWYLKDPGSPKVIFSDSSLLKKILNGRS